MARLTGEVDWGWHEAEAASFQILKEEADKVLAMHGHEFDLPIQMYSDVSGYGAGCVIMQMQNGVLVPILYDSFLLVKHQRHYGTYKR